MTEIEYVGFADRQLDEFRRWQRTSYAVLSEVVAQLTEGTTERDATRLAMKAYRREGAQTSQTAIEGASRRALSVAVARSASGVYVV